MISYELAKELKDAGFPQESESGHLVDQDGIVVTQNQGGYFEMKGTAYAYIPTLEELIKTLYLNDKKQLHLKITNTTFVKYKIIDQEGKVVFELNCGGDSLLEALARLWLYLKHDYILINPL